MMLLVRYRKNIMLKSLQLLKDGYRGLTSASSSAQSLSQESKRAPSKLKENIQNRVNQVTSGMKEAPIILSVLGQALATTSDIDLIKMIRIVHNELGNLITEYEFDEAKQIATETPVIELNGYQIEAVTFTE